MHIPDGFLDAKTALAAAALAATGLGLALRRVQRDFPPRRIPVLGLTAAVIFAAQMLNFPVAGGTSGHLIGAVLAAVLLGPAAAVVVMSSVLILQCFLFADGGVTALGANILNMGVVAPAVGYVIYAGCSRAVNGWRGRFLGAAFAAWCSTVAAAICCAGELSASGTVPWTAVFPAMAGIHMLIGIGEALITSLILAAVAVSRPELVERAGAAGRSDYGMLVALGLLVAVAVALFASPFASAWPDGLEKAAEHLGFASRAHAEPLVPSPIPDYTMPGIGSAVWATGVAGLIGTILMFIFSYMLARILVSKSSSHSPLAINH